MSWPVYNSNRLIPGQPVSRTPWITSVGKSLAASHTTNPEAQDFYVRLEEQTCVPIPHSIRGRSTSPHWSLSLLPTEPSKLLITRPFISLLPASCGHSHALPNLFPRAITDGDLQLR